jgi:endoglucanase
VRDSTHATFDGFVHAERGRLVDGEGRPLLMRGVGLGNWLLAEGYMWGFDDAGPQSPRQIEVFIEDLIGPTEAAAFWRTFRDRFIGEADIERIAAEGMDHVRLPINARLVIDEDGRLIDDGIALVDRLIEWCRTHELWVVLDLHGAPGGQTGTNIDDSPRNLPDLFLEGGGYRDLTIALWRQLARRYRDEPVVAGYDLLNEPLPNEYADRFATELVALYRDLTAAIRAEDPNHLIIYEGTRWSTDWSIFTEVWDPNSMLQFHKYWSPPDRPSIARFIAAGERLGLPIYMGEGGENNLDWLQTAFQLYEDCGISWNLWPWKKIDTITSPRSIRPPAGWDAIRAYAERRGPRPADRIIGSALTDLLEGIRLERTDDRAEVLNAVLRRVPLRLPASGFGFGGRGIAYETGGADPMVDFRSDDLVTIRRASGPSGAVPRFDHTDGRTRGPDERLEVALEAGDWVSYELTIDKPSRLRVRVESGWPEMTPGEAPIICIGSMRLPERVVRGGVEASSPAPMPAGRHAIKVLARAPETVIGSIEVGLVA